MQTLALKTLALPVISLAGIATWVVFLMERRQTRAALAKLSDSHLADIGVTYRQARAETRKSFFV